MKQKFIAQKINYDGSQLSPLFAYMHHAVHGDSIVAFEGACHVGFDKMIDAEDLVAKAKIESDSMLHFIVEMFHQDLTTAVSLQRLLVSIAEDILNSTSTVLKNKKIWREGDDLYLDKKDVAHKLTISIASKSAVSTMIHLGFNIKNEGTPVATCSLEDLKINAKKFAEVLMEEFCSEYNSIIAATQKVKPLG